jgi:hypothetical protein
MPLLLFALSFAYPFLIFVLIPFDLPSMLVVAISGALAIPTFVGLLWLFMEKILPLIILEKPADEKSAGTPWAIRSHTLDILNEME